jgi:hypothetical protein
MAEAGSDQRAVGETSFPRGPAAHGASFRDGDGCIFEENGKFLRRINPNYAPTHARLKESGFYARLWRDGWLIPHREVANSDGGIVLEPEQLAVITYPYEWSFGQLRDAALLTVRIQRAAMEAGFSLKDASAYNVQFHQGRAVLIDTLSFEPYEEGKPWTAYRQFCQHFLAPLALMAWRDPRLGLLARNHIDGIPLDLASALLPWRTKLRTGLLLHLHLHARAQARYLNRDEAVAARPISRHGLLGILDSLESAVRSLRWQPGGTEWADYYDQTNYSPAATGEKESVVRAWVTQCSPRLVWDLGANDGRFSRIAAATGATTVAWDIDAGAVEQCYRAVVRTGDKNLVPALLDLTNPSPALGWELRERLSLFERRRPDLVLALALLHHLAIGNNVPLDRCAGFFRRVGDKLVIEWIPKSDSKVQALLRNRPDIFPDYTEHGFRTAFARHFPLVERHPLAGSDRVLYLMRTAS